MTEQQFEFKNLEITGSDNSPQVVLHRNGKLSFSGNSLLENPGSFYWNIHRWIQEYISNPATNTTLDFKLNYVNSGSMVFITKIITAFNDTIGINTELVLNWYYESEDTEMKDVGLFFGQDTKGEFNLIETEKI